MKPHIILIAGGGHCKSCIDVIEQEGKYKIAGVVDIGEKLNQSVLGYEIIAVDEDLPDLVDQYKNFIITIGQIKSPDKRIALFEKVRSLGAGLPYVISPSAYVSRHARVGEGSIIMHHALVNAGAIVGNNCIINSKALIEHDTSIGDHCHISTGAVINGGCRIGDGTLVGSNAVVRENIEVGGRALIGSNTKIAENVPSASKVR